jgi:prepilin peptidase CpaA
LFLVVALVWSDRVPIFEHIGAGLLVFGVGAVIFRLGVLGGGDIKLLTAVAFWVGWERLGIYLLVVAIFGGGLTLFLLALRALLRRVYRSRPPEHSLPRILRVDEKIPYAIAIGAAGIWIAPYLPLLALAV